MTAKRFEQIIIHVGQPKTGTTHIQNALAANTDYLLSLGLYYPVPRQGMTGHHALVRQVDDKAEKKLERNFLGEHGDDELILSALEAQTDAQIAVLSSEILLANFASNIDKMRALDDRFRSLAETVRYVAYVREPVSRYSSVISQTLMNSVLIPQPHWASMLQPLITLHDEVGSRLEVRTYNRATLVGGDILEDFLVGVVGTDIGTCDLELAKSHSNVSLSGEAMFLVQSIAILRQMANPTTFPRHDAAMRSMAWFIRRIDTELDDHGSGRLLPEVAETIMANAANDLLWLHKTFGIELGQPASSATTLRPGENGGLRLVRSVFEVDPDRTVSLADRLRSHPRCPEGLAELLDRILMPSN